MGWGRRSRAEEGQGGGPAADCGGLLSPRNWGNSTGGAGRGAGCSKVPPPATCSRPLSKAPWVPTSPLSAWASCVPGLPAERGASCLALQTPPHMPSQPRPWGRLLPSAWFQTKQTHLGKAKATTSHSEGLKEEQGPAGGRDAFGSLRKQLLRLCLDTRTVSFDPPWSPRRAHVLLLTKLLVSRSSPHCNSWLTCVSLEAGSLGHGSNL